ncbi:toluene tolerance family protein [Thioalkalivibrio sulfidiphilus HL-EbGr7]|uniref:Toluene tolerance family protein n=1 Tax=Thioalkalivibrio sulfidiphilus (strain HL-EbGR7) TaxID=396588 RepID=B8GMK0_THISH|nr:ABC transporter substrate-binding protein [Thioalkalivibrio sulfidiphilus]ACL71832.1 toluene tolerance family protein [Thioalkalivibrio sulfidiphilus HL-EbGr7]
MDKLKSAFNYPVVLLLALALGWTSTLWASPGDPAREVGESANRVLEMLRENSERLKNDETFVFSLVEQEILPSVDFQGMSRLILARHWRTASPEQRERFVEAFTNTMVRAYAGQLAEHADKRIIVNERRSRVDGERATVATEIVVGQGRPNVPVTYSLRIVDDRWKAYDLTVEGLSLVTNFRTNFNNEIERGGLENLIQRLEQGDRDLVRQAVEQ